MSICVATKKVGWRNNAKRSYGMTEQDTSQRVVRGTVKWFDPGKGFGFVVAEEGGPDILLHSNVLRNFGQSSVADGAGIEIQTQETSRGVQAVEILSIAPPDTGVTQLEEGDSILIEDDESLELEPARVKWFDKSKGFGFANAFGRHEDIFIHVEVLRRSGLADLQPGEAVCLRVMDGKRGRMATRVLSWEMALRD